MDFRTKCQIIIIGRVMILWGVILTGIGVWSSFNRVILLMGNILLLLGFIMAFKLEDIFRFFQGWQHLKALICLALGFLCVIKGSTIIGMMLESCGVIVLACGRLCKCKEAVVALTRSPVNLYLVYWFVLVISVNIIEAKYGDIILAHFAPHV